MTIQLSNFLCDRADFAGDAFRRHKRASRESIEAYVEAAYALLEARDECRRGEWTAVLERAGIETRTARYAVQIARSGATADDIEAAGGIRGYRESLAEKAEPGSANGTEQSEETPPEYPGDAPSETTSPDERTDTESTPGALSDPHPPIDPALVHVRHPMREEIALSPQARRRADKQARGECLDCSNPAENGVYCTGCATKRSRRRKQQRADARTGAALRPRLVIAAERGIGVRLTAEEVANLAPDND